MGGTISISKADLATVLRYALSLTSHLAFTIRREAEDPSRELRRQLEKIAAVARPGRHPTARQFFLRDALTDLRILALLGDDCQWPWTMIDDIGGRARRALQRSPARGRGKLHPNTARAPNALEYCALIVSMSWHKATECWPGKANAAHAICEVLWLAAGGSPKQHRTIAARPGTVTVWRKHLVAARRYRPPHPAGEVVARGLAGDPVRRRPQPTPEQSRRYRAFLDHPASIAARRICPNPQTKTDI
jgi:hypothetical protein